MMKNLPKNIIILLVGVGLATLIMFAYGTCNKPTPVIPKVITTIKEDKKAIEALKNDYDKRIEQIQSISDKRGDTITLMNKRLKIASYSLRKTADSLRILLNDTVPVNDETVNDYIDKSLTADSTCNEQVQRYQRQLESKDLVIDNIDEYNRRLQVINDSLLSNKQALLSVNKDLTKQLRGKKVGNFIWKTAAVALIVKVAVDLIK